MARYIATGKTTATAATIDHLVASIWNPSSSKRIKVVQLHVFKVTAGAADEPVVRRHTTQGTPASTITPTAVNEQEKIAAPPSAFLLNLGAFSAQPTLEALGLYGAIIPGAIGAGLMWVWEEIEIPAGNGLAVTAGIALAFPASRVTAIVED